MAWRRKRQLREPELVQEEPVESLVAELGLREVVVGNG